MLGMEDPASASRTHGSSTRLLDATGVPRGLTPPHCTRVSAEHPGNPEEAPTALAKAGERGGEGFEAAGTLGQSLYGA